jgi:hypothetical protein
LYPQVKVKTFYNKGRLLLYRALAVGAVYRYQQCQQYYFEFCHEQANWIVIDIFKTVYPLFENRKKTWNING